MSRHRFQAILGALILAAPALPVPALAFTGAELQRFCADPAASVVCVSYLRGYVDGFGVGATQAGPADRLYCPPSAGLAVEQARLIVEKFLRDYPEGLDRDAGLLVGAVLMATFPCRR